MHMGDAPGIGTAADIKVGVTTITSGTTGRILYDNGGTLGEMTTTGSGTVVVLATGATLVTPALGVATATSLALGGATIGSNALAVTGTSAFSGRITATGNIDTTYIHLGLGSGTYVTSDANGNVLFQNNAGSVSTYISFPTSANLQLGAAAVDTAPVAQTLSVQNVLAGGTLNVAGALWTFQDSAGKGSATSGGYAFQTHPAGSSGTGVNAAVTALAIAGSGVATFSNAVAITVDRSLTLTNQTSSAGAQVGTLTNAPAAGNPGYWAKISIGGVNYSFPCWAG